MNETDETAFLEWLEIVFAKLEATECPVTDPGQGVLYLCALNPHMSLSVRADTVAMMEFGGQ